MLVVPNNLQNNHDGSRKLRSNDFERLNLVSVSEFTLKAEQELALNALLAGIDVLEVLPTGYRKRLIYQMFVRAKNHEPNRNASILAISPLKSIIEDQRQEMESLGYHAADCSNLSVDNIHRCEIKILYATAKKVKEKAFREILIDTMSNLHRNVLAIVVYESHTVETWTGKR